VIRLYPEFANVLRRLSANRLKFGFDFQIARDYAAFVATRLIDDCLWPSMRRDGDRNN
jgi:hypothetical protein